MERSFSSEIGSNTILVRGIGKSICEIVNIDKTIEISVNCKKLMDNTCLLFGSSLSGRIESSRKWLGCDYKLPIVLDEIRNIIFFPTRSIESLSNIWISFNIIEDYKAKDNGIELILKNGDTYFLNESYNVFENQYIRAFKLHKRIEKMKTTILQ